MARPAIEVKGAAQLRRTLKRAGLDVQDLKDAHKKIAEDVVREAAPDAPRRTGRLASTVRPAGTASAAIVRAGRKTVPWAGPVHWGWPAHHMKAQPWLAEAADREFDHAQDVILDTLQKIIATVEGTTTP
jgi:hypothetical protein